MSSVELPNDGRATTRFVFEDPTLADDRQRTVYVDPGTGQVRGQLVTWSGATPAVTWLDDLHRNLHLGEVGRHYSEIAASWLWVVVLGGVVLWLGRRRDRGRGGGRRLQRVLLPDLAARGRRRTLSWHGSVGLLLAVGLLFLSATGLTWSRYAGERLTAVLEAANATAPELDTVLSGATATSSSPGDVDRVLGAARAAGLGGPVELVPELAGSAWSVTQIDARWPVHKDAVAVDPASGEVTATARFGDRPLLSQLSSLGVDAHMGVLFGPVSQALLAALALGLTCLVLWGYRSWWQRRPRDRPVGRLPRRGTWRRLPLPGLVLGIAALAALGWALPLLGVTLAGFLLLDLLLGRLASRTSSQHATTTRTQQEDDEEELPA